MLTPQTRESGKAAKRQSGGTWLGDLKVTTNNCKSLIPPPKESNLSCWDSPGAGAFWGPVPVPCSPAATRKTAARCNRGGQFLCCGLFSGCQRFTAVTHAAHRGNAWQEVN